LTPTLKPKSNHSPGAGEAAESAELVFADNGLALQLFGSHHENLARIEQKMDVSINARGNEVTITGEREAVEGTCGVLEGLYARLEKGKDVGHEEVDATLRMATAPGGDIGNADLIIRTKKRHISPRSPVQAEYLQAIDRAELVFGEGPAVPSRGRGGRTTGVPARRHAREGGPLSSAPLRRAF